MEHTFNDMDELIGKYLAGEATPDEVAQVEAWAQLSDSKKKYVEQFKLIFEKAVALKSLQQFDEDAAWNKMKTRLHNKPAKTVNFPAPKKSSGTSMSLVWKIAASIIVILGMGYYAFKNNNSTQHLSKTEVVADAKSISDTLPDGSDVFLNKKTKLSYVFDKKKKKHFVKLKGEAFFTIKHDEKKNFIVEADGIYIRDIGTSFNVKAYPESNTIEVVVKEGAVEFFNDTDTGVYLTAGGKGVYNKLTKAFTIAEPETNVLAYKTKFFSFSNQTLQSVVNDLNEVYDQRIELDSKVKNCRLTVTFNNENIDEVANVIAETLGLVLKHRSGKIILEGSGCE